MKFLPLLFVVLSASGCTVNTSSNAANSSDNESKKIMLDDSFSLELEQALTLAKDNQDYRLFVTSGRSMSIPGVKSENYQEMVERCGKKYNPSTGDVITSEEQSLERKKAINFMRKYNEQIIIFCGEKP